MTDLGRLRWRCRRGMKELDVLLERYVNERYVNERYADAFPGEQAAFEGLLDIQDPIIYAYCMGQEPPPVHLAALVERITGLPAGKPSG